MGPGNVGKDRSFTAEFTDAQKRAPKEVALGKGPSFPTRVVCSPALTLSGLVIFAELGGGVFLWLYLHFSDY